MFKQCRGFRFQIITQNKIMIEEGVQTLLTPLATFLFLKCDGMAMCSVPDLHRKSMDIFKNCDLFAVAKNTRFWKQMFLVVILIMQGI